MVVSRVSCLATNSLVQNCLKRNVAIGASQRLNGQNDQKNKDCLYIVTEASCGKLHSVSSQAVNKASIVESRQEDAEAELLDPPSSGPRCVNTS